MNLRRWMLFCLLFALSGNLYAISGSVVISGAEQLTGPGTWDVGVATIYINGYAKSFAYGQYSTADSLASGIAGTLSNDPNAPANAKSAPGGVINVQMRYGVALTQLSLSLSSNVSFHSGTDNPTLTPTTTIATISSHVVPPGYSATVDVQVSCNSACGSVDYRIDDSEWGTVSLDGSGHFTAATSTSLAAGLHTVVISFLGNGSYAASTSNPVSFTLQSTTGETPSTKLYGYSIGPYAPNGNILGYKDSVNGQWVNIDYDSLNRLTAATVLPQSGPTMYDCWTYDPFGNRTSQTNSSTPCDVASPPAQTSQAGYNGNNQINFSNLAPGGFSYDASGNVTNDGTNQYLYDAEGRVCASAQASTLIGGMIMTQYIYDANGNRVAKGTISTWSCDMEHNGFAPTSEYLLGDGGEQLTEIGSNGSPVHSNIYANGQLIATYKNDDTWHFHLADWLGTKRVQTDSVGNVEQTCTSGPYGDAQPCVGVTEQFFTGKERDAESGLDYFGARYYGSSMGRMMSPDPLGGQLTNPQSLNKYAYALDNPLTNTDPTGMYVCQDSAKCDSDQDKAFEASRQADLKSKDASVVRGASAYGDPTKDNGVTVKFGDPGKGNDAITSHDLGADPNDPTKTRAVETVTVKTGLSGSGLDAAVGHEGSHVADAQDFAATINASGNFDASKNLSQYQTEFKAYMNTNSVLNGEGLQASYGQCNGGPCTLGQSVSGKQLTNTINQLLANPQNGYGVTPQNPGKLLYPSLTTPQKPQ